jgi:hypothetical protein
MRPLILRAVRGASRNSSLHAPKVEKVNCANCLHLTQPLLRQKFTVSFIIALLLYIICFKNAIECINFILNVTICAQFYILFLILVLYILPFCQTKFCYKSSVKLSKLIIISVYKHVLIYFFIIRKAPLFQSIFIKYFLRHR